MYASESRRGRVCEIWAVIRPDPVTFFDAFNPFPATEIRMRDPMAVGPVRRLPTPPLRSPGSAPWLPGFV